MKISIPIQRRCKHFKTPAPKGPGKRGHIVADTLLLMMFLGLRKLGNICRGHKMFLTKIKNSFCVPDTKNTSDFVQKHFDNKLFNKLS